MYKTVIMFILLTGFAFAADAAHGPSLSGLYWRIGVFAVFFIVLFKLLKPKIVSGLGSSVDQVAKAMKEAKQTYDDSEKELAEYTHKINGMHVELERMKQNALESAEREATMMIEEAQKSAIRQQEQTARNINAEIAKLRIDLQHEVSVLALAAAEAELAKASDSNAKQGYIKKQIPYIGVN
jgi:F0F1-type ATP synthase membrane subunit b/b'